MHCLVASQRVTRPEYPSEAPFHPHTRYPEYRGSALSTTANHAYDGVRECLRLMRMDEARFGSAQWNPFGALLRPGQSVFIKPNLIAESAKNNPSSWMHVITHGSVIRAVVDYCYMALEGRGRIAIGDGPQTDSNMELILSRTGISSIIRYYEEEFGFRIDFMDLRDEYWHEQGGVVVDTKRLPGDPNGTVAFNLAKDSYLAEYDGKGRRYYGAFYDVDETNRHHCDGIHEYLVCKSPLQCDLFINIPKLKTHKKVGMTLNLKSLVGINGNKNWLPHYAMGAPDTNGDQFDKVHVKKRIEHSLVIMAKRLLLGRNRFVQYVAQRAKGLAYKIFGDTETVIRSGNWHGNDTCWRMSLDLNRILLYGNIDGSLRTDGTRKKYFSVVDGIIGMEGHGPAAGPPVQSGLILAGYDPLNVDLVAATLIGFDPMKMPLLARAFDDSVYSIASNAPDEVTVLSNDADLHHPLRDLRPPTDLRFEPHFAWKGHIETGIV